MTLPTYDALLSPILELAAKENVTRVSATAAMIVRFGLTPEEASARIPSGGSTYLQNRTGWAMTFLTKARLIQRVAPRNYRATSSGIEMLSEHPRGITVQHLKQVPGWEEAWRTNGDDRSDTSAKDGAHPLATETPFETIDRASRALGSALKTQLLETILAQSPTFFEYLVLDVLVAMGYGGSREDAAQHMGQTNDEGIDGCINQDALGLDKIFVQAKRYAPDRSVGRPAIQSFIGSLVGKGVRKGVFITTSSFSDKAEDLVASGANTKVVLTDGAMLIDMMMRYKVGVRVERSVEILELDQNYFGDEE